MLHTEKSFKIKKTALVLIITLLLTICLPSCAEKEEERVITGKNMFDGTYAKISVSGYNVLPGALESDGGVTFSSSKSLDEIYDALKDSKDFTVTKCTDSLLFAFPVDGYSNAYCLTECGEKSYQFGSLQCELVVGIAYYGYDSRQILFPRHLINDDAVSIQDNILYINSDYEIYGTPDDFVSFYRDCRWYDVSENEDGSVITVKESSAVQESKSEPFTLTFTEKEGKTYFTISYQGTSEATNE